MMLEIEPRAWIELGRNENLKNFFEKYFQDIVEQMAAIEPNATEEYKNTIADLARRLYIVRDMQNVIEVGYTDARKTYE